MQEDHSAPEPGAPSSSHWMQGPCCTPQHPCCCPGARAKTWGTCGCTRGASVSCPFGWLGWFGSWETPMNPLQKPAHKSPNQQFKPPTKGRRGCEITWNWFFFLAPIWFDLGSIDLVTPWMDHMDGIIWACPQKGVFLLVPP